MIKKHLFFGVHQQNEHNVFTKLRTCKAGADGLCFKPDLVRYENLGEIYDSVSDLENRVVNYIVSKYEANLTLYPNHYTFDTSAGISDLTKFVPFQRINQVQSTVAIRTRRGWPNVLLVNPFLMEILRFHSYNYYGERMLKFDTNLKMIEGSNFTPIGYYLGKGYRGCELYCNKSWGPKHPALMAYVGNSPSDAGPFIVELNDGRHKLVLPDEGDPDIFATWETYINLMRII